MNKERIILVLIGVLLMGAFIALVATRISFSCRNTANNYTMECLPLLIEQMNFKCAGCFTATSQYGIVSVDINCPWSLATSIISCIPVGFSILFFGFYLISNKNFWTYLFGVIAFVFYIVTWIMMLTQVFKTPVIMQTSFGDIITSGVAPVFNTVLAFVLACFLVFMMIRLRQTNALTKQKLLG